jgi:hypothetical protein
VRKDNETGGRRGERWYTAPDWQGVQSLMIGVSSCTHCYLALKRVTIEGPSLSARTVLLASLCVLAAVMSGTPPCSSPTTSTTILSCFLLVHTDSTPSYCACPFQCSFPSPIHFALKMEAARPTETMVSYYVTTQCQPRRPQPES